MTDAVIDGDALIDPETGEVVLQLDSRDRLGDVVRGLDRARRQEKAWHGKAGFLQTVLLDWLPADQRAAHVDDLVAQRITRSDRVLNTEALWADLDEKYSLSARLSEAGAAAIYDLLGAVRDITSTKLTAPGLRLLVENCREVRGGSSYIRIVTRAEEA